MGLYHRAELYRLFVVAIRPLVWRNILTTKGELKMSIQLPETVLQTVPSSDRSNRYSMVPTITLIQHFESNGFEVDRVTTSHTYKPEWQGHQKHMVRMIYPGMQNKEGTPTINIYNSSNGSSQVIIEPGFLVKVCSNGLITHMKHAQYMFRHTTGKTREMYTLLDTMLSSFDTMLHRIESMQHKTLATYDQWKMAEYAIGLRWESHSIPFPVSSMLNGHHLEQNDSTVWNIFNRVQANLIRGFEYQQGRKHKKTRSIKSIEKDREINTKLWEYADSLV